MNKTFDKRFFILLLPLIGIMLFFLLVPYFVIHQPFIENISSNKAEVGTVIGGIAGPLIAIGAAILTFFAFWIQFKANEQQKNDLYIERFENKFYNLIQIHRNNVSEFKIAEKTLGRKACVSMFKELKFSYQIVKHFYTQEYIVNHPNDPKQENILYNIAYLIFFFGIGENSSLIVRDLIGVQNQVFFNEVESFIENEKKNYKKKKVETDGSLPKINLKYRFLDGHTSRLSHYIRNLFQIVAFVDEQNEKHIPYEKKMQYIATLRSQLTVHEQLLIYYNALSILGKPWLDRDYFITYCLLKSLPIPLANFYISPLQLLPEVNARGKCLFEWSEIKERANNLII